jgi:Trypsin
MVLMGQQMEGAYAQAMEPSQVSLPAEPPAATAPAKQPGEETQRQDHRAHDYGVNRFEIDIEPPPQSQPAFLDDRYRATVRLLNTKDSAIGEMFVKTTGVSLIKGKGEASCYGDSGGPLFVGDQQTIVGVTSFGLAPLCRGPGYYQRVDLPRVLT